MLKIGDKVEVIWSSLGLAIYEVVEEDIVYLKGCDRAAFGYNACKNVKELETALNDEQFGGYCTWRIL